MGLFDNVLDWAADKVQTVTGEKERRELVQSYKNKYLEFKECVEEYIDAINEKIQEFNLLIKKLNQYRASKVSSNIVLLHDFLGKFGNIKLIGEYAEEKTSTELVVPEKQFENKENYISDIDWSKDDVFINSFLLSPIGMKMKTRKQNLSMREQLGEFELEINETINQFEIKKYNVQKDQEVALLYMECITVISEYISKYILPELEVVEAFFQSLTIKNEIIAGNELQELTFTNDISFLKDTPYERHFHFVRNAFMFYVISCRIFDTAVLTNLINGDTSDNDLTTLQDNKKVLLEQKNNVNKYLTFIRG